MELHNLYRNANLKIMLMSHGLWWAEHVANMEDGRRAHKLLLGKPRGNCTHGRLKMRWEDNISSDFEKIDYGADWKTLAHDMLTWSIYVLVATKVQTS